MSCRFRTRCTFFVLVPVLVAGMVLWQQIQAQAQAIGSPSAGNNWDTTSAVQVFATSGDAAGRPSVNIINGSGVSGQYGQFQASAAGAQSFNDYWMARNLNGDGTPNPTYTGSAQPGTVVGSHWIELQFDQAYNMGTTWLWNWNENGSGYNGASFGWKDINIQYSTDNATWHTAFTGQVAEAPGQGTTSSPNLVFNFPAGAQAQYVVLTNTGLGNDQNWGAAATLGDNFDAGLAEVRFWLAGATVPSVVPGDINGDGHVDLTDYGILTSHWQQTVTANSAGDLTGDGLVDIRDFAVFKQDYNSFNGISGGSGLAGPPVPEPCTLILLSMALPALFIARLCKNKRAK